MPLEGARYRMKPMKGGGYERLAFKGKNDLVETKNMQSGATHTPAEFAADRAGGLQKLFGRKGK